MLSKMSFNLNGQKKQQIDSGKRSIHLSEEELSDRRSTSSTDSTEQRNEEEIKCQRSTRKAAKKWNKFDYLTYASSDEECKSSDADSNDDSDPAWTPAPLQVYQYKYIFSNPRSYMPCYSHLVQLFSTSKTYPN